MARTYLADILGWHWEAIVAEAKRNRFDCQSELVPCGEPPAEWGACYLGTVFNLCPSGKYYTPWARSNAPQPKLAKTKPGTRPWARWPTNTVATFVTATVTPAIYSS